MDTNWVDIAKQNLDSFRGALGSLEAAVKDVAPVVWQTTMRQTIIDGCELAVSAVILLTALFIFIVLIRRNWDNMRDKDGDPVGGVFSIIGCVFIFGGIVVCVVNAVDLLANPIYWSMFRVLHIVLHQGD